MDKIIMKNGTILDIFKISGINIYFKNKSKEEIENIFTKENCSEIIFINEKNEIYGKYIDMECLEILEDVKSNIITINLKKIDKF